jgi:hypothetical protein
VLVSFCNIVSVAVPPPDIAKNFISSWTSIFMDNSLWEFIFQCLNNLPRTGDRLSHILTNVDDSCYLCRNLLRNMSSRETFVHFFRNCPVTAGWIHKFNCHFKLVWNVHDFNFEKLYWFGDLNGLLDRQSLLLFDIFRYQLWSMRQRKVVNYDLIVYGTVNTLRTIFLIKPAIRANFLNNNSVANIVQAIG